MLKDLKIGVGHEVILKNYDPDALNLYNSTSDLKEVFVQLSDINRNKNKEGNVIQKVFIPIRPMLSGKMNINQIKNMISNCESGVLVETKYDGERIQCHMQDKIVKFFSRNSINCTNVYGPKMSPLIAQSVNAKACILDGEIIVWDS